MGVLESSDLIQHSSSLQRLGSSEGWPTLREVRRGYPRIPYVQAAVASISHFFRSRIWDDPNMKPDLSPTTWMDGLRGCAALIVFNYHFLFAFTDSTGAGFGSDEQHRSWVELPFVRVLYDGATCVNIFFVIAGYVCSAKALQLMTTSNPPGSTGGDKILTSLSCSVFRRLLRLYLPVTCMMFLTTMASYLGLFEPLRGMIAQKDIYFRPQFTEPSVPRCATLKAQLHFWLQELYSLSNMWNVGPVYPEHDPHLWTIGFEARMSMHLYITLVGLARCKARVRLGGLVALAATYLFWNRWEGPLFFLGAALAQSDALRKTRPDKLAESSTKDTLPGSPTQPAPSTQADLAIRIGRAALYVFALYLMSYPIRGFKKPTPGFRWVNALIPAFYSRKEKFPKSVGVLIFVALLQTSRHTAVASPTPSFWHRLFTCRFARYLGHHMFALYLVHGPVLHVVGYGIPHLVWRFVGQGNAVSWWLGVLLGWAASLLLCLGAAEVFTRHVDARCASLIRRLEALCMKED